MKLAELVTRLSGQLEGDGDIDIRGVKPLESAEAGDLSYLAMHSYREKAMQTKASAVIVVAPIPDAPFAQIVCDDPYLGFAHAMGILYPTERPEPGVSPQALVDPSASLADGVHIGAFTTLGKGVHIGANTVIHPHVHIADHTSIGQDCVIHSHVSVREHSRIGNRVILQNGCRIGSDGYGFAKTPEGRFVKIPQMGHVVIEDDVEIGANCCVDRSTMEITRIGRGTKLDNLVQVGHNVQVGEDSLLVAQVGIAGSTVIGNGVTLAGQVGVSGHLTIGDGVTVGGKAGVTRDIPPGEIYAGYPAIPYRLWTHLQHALQDIIASQQTREDSEP